MSDEPAWNGEGLDRGPSLKAKSRFPLDRGLAHPFHSCNLILGLKKLFVYLYQKPKQQPQLWQKNILLSVTTMVEKRSSLETLNTLSMMYSATLLNAVTAGTTRFLRNQNQSRPWLRHWTILLSNAGVTATTTSLKLLNFKLCKEHANINNRFVLYLLCHRIHCR